MFLVRPAENETDQLTSSDTTIYLHGEMLY